MHVISSRNRMQAPVPWHPGRTPLWRNGEQGGLYEPWDLSTLFQDNAGTTPVTGPDQTVGLVYDKRLMGGKDVAFYRMEQPELVTNGNFQAGTSNWVSQSGGVLSIEGSRLKVTNSVNNLGMARQMFAVVVGRTYELTMMATPGTHGARIHLGTTAGGTQYALRANLSGLITHLVTATAADLSIAMGPTSFVAGDHCSFDCVSIKEMPGNHLSQASQPARPKLGRHPVGGRRNLLLQTAFAAVWNMANAATTPAADEAVDVVPAAGIRTLNNDGPRQYVNELTSGAAAISVDFESLGARYAVIGVSNGAGFTGTASFDLLTGLVATLNGHPSAALNRSASMELVGPGRWRCTLRLTSVSMNWVHLTCSTVPCSGTYFRDITADGTSGVRISRPQVQLGAETPFQRVLGAFDVTQEGLADCWYLEGDGVDDTMASAFLPAVPVSSAIAVSAGTHVTKSGGNISFGVQHSNSSRKFGFRTSSGGLQWSYPASNGDGTEGGAEAINLGATSLIPKRFSVAYGPSEVVARIEQVEVSAQRPPRVVPGSPDGGSIRLFSTGGGRFYGGAIAYNPPDGWAVPALESYFGDLAGITS